MNHSMDVVASARERELAELLRDLTSAQQQLLELLAEKRRLLAGREVAGLQALQPREQQWLAAMQQCYQRRETLLREAEQAGLPSRSLGELAESLPGGRGLRGPLQEATHRARLLKHESLAGWVLAQRSLLHLTQLLEIIATGGRERPTYGREPPSTPGGCLVDQAA